MVTRRLRPKPTQSNRDLLDAVRRGNAEAARECHYNHRQESSAVLTDILAKYRLPSL